MKSWSLLYFLMDIGAFWKLFCLLFLRDFIERKKTDIFLRELIERKNKYFLDLIEIKKTEFFLRELKEKKKRKLGYRVKDCAPLVRLSHSVTTEQL